jgi:hypothetical protein
MLEPIGIREEEFRMYGTLTALVSALRSMAIAGSKPSEMVRMLISHHASLTVEGRVDRNLLVQYFSEAFCFSDGEGYALFGWRPDGVGEIDDAKIACLLGKRIQKTRKEWENVSAV